MCSEGAPPKRRARALPRPCFGGASRCRRNAHCSAEPILAAENVHGFECLVKSCTTCARGTASHLRSGGLLQPPPVTFPPWEDISIDLIVGLPVTEEGFDAIATIVCRLTKMAHFGPTKQTAAAEDLLRAIIRNVRLRGVLRGIVSDRDTPFTGKLWRGLSEQLNVKQRMSTRARGIGSGPARNFDCCG